MSIEEGDGIDSIRRRGARSGNVSYGDPVVLHETSRTRVELVPFYVPRSHGTDLAVKLVSYRKGDPTQSWVIAEKTSVSLQEAAARRLASALRKHLAVSTQKGDGDYIVIRIDEGTTDYGDLDPEQVTLALTRALSRKDILEHLTSTELGDELITAFRGAIRLREMQSAVASLRQHLAQEVTDERVYQEWCEGHSWAFGNAYVMTDRVRDISAGDRVDLLMPTVISGYRDIVELKRPDHAVLQYDQSHRNYYFSAEVSKALGQVNRYMDVLHETAANGLRDHPEIVAYHPRSIIVIGRSSDWDPEQVKALHGLNARFSGVTIMTYDQLLAQGERLIDMLSSTQTELFQDPVPDFPQLDGDGDFPF